MYPVFMRSLEQQNFLENAIAARKMYYKMAADFPKEAHIYLRARDLLLLSIVENTLGET